MGGYEEWDGEQEGPEPEAEHSANLPAPWETEDEPAEDEAAARQRHDAFTPARKKAFLKVLSRTGCILDGCRAVGVSPRTVYNHQGTDYEFLKHCTLAVKMAGVTIELAAFERGVVGVEEEVFRGSKLVGTRIKHSDSVLRLLLQGANRKKYGPRPGFTRKRLLKHERKEMEREIRARIAAERPPEGELAEILARKLELLEARTLKKKLASGWTRTEEGHMIPPGWVRIEDGQTGPGPDGGGPCESGDSMWKLRKSCNSRPRRRS